MSRDIRSYFKCGTALTTPKPEGSTVASRKRVISSDEDEPKERSPKKRTKIHEKRQKSHFLSDSDDEVIVVKSIQQEKQKKIEKVISPQDIFGTASVKRSPAPKVQKKVPDKQGKQQLIKKEAEFHNDDDFDDTLNQLDTSAIEEEYLASIENNEVNNFKSSDSKSPQKSDNKSNHNKDKIVEKITEIGKKRKGHVDDRKDKKKSKSSNSEKKSPRKDKEEKLEKSGEKLNLKKSCKQEKSSLKITVENKSPKKNNVQKVEVNGEKDIFEEKIEKKKQSAALYQQYLSRGGARNPGSKEIPEGATLCLAGLSFLITGVLDSLEREEVDELITKYGGRILHSVSRKTNYVIVGDQPGPSKLAKADSYGIKKITEDDLLELIRTRPAGKSSEVVLSHHKSKEKEKVLEAEFVSPVETPSPKKEAVSINAEVKKPKSNEMQKTSLKLSSPAKDIKNLQEKKNVESSVPKVDNIQQLINSVPTEALVEKYRPKKLKQIIGQQGEKSNAQKLYKWLSDWHKNRSVKHTKPTPWMKNDSGAFFKTALLSGSPGIGKTTTVQVVCNELGFDLIEFNASDTRSKKLLREEVSGLLSNTTMKGYFTGDSKEKPSKKHLLLMDEVDGMAGNEDRGGLQELIALIKSTSIPIVCICNDRNNPKMRTLANYVYDLRFSKPRIEQIKAAMMSLCFKEGIQISGEDLTRLIESTDQDVRQVVNHLALLSANPDCKKEKSLQKEMHKDLRLGPWEVVRKVFSSEEHKKMSIHDKSNLFFHDYSIAPLFVQENYLSVTPNVPKNEVLDRISQAAESLALGDIVENKIRKNGAWSLLPIQACFSSVIPGFHMSGRIVNQINFPNWLGRNSKTGKFDRLMQELTVHTRLATGASKEAITLDYLNPLRDSIVRPLVTMEAEGIEQAVETMNKYHLVREDLDSMIEVSVWLGQRDPMQSVNSKVKAAFTRAYNKNSAAYAYSAIGVSKKKASQDEGYIEGEDIGDTDPESDKEDDINNDKMIKAKKPSKAAASTSKVENKSSKRGRGRGKAKQ